MGIGGSRGLGVIRYWVLLRRNNKKKVQDICFIMIGDENVNRINHQYTTIYGTECGEAAVRHHNMQYRRVMRDNSCTIKYVLSM